MAQPILHPADQLVEPVALAGRQGAGRLVHDHQPRLGQHRLVRSRPSGAGRRSGCRPGRRAAGRGRTGRSPPAPCAASRPGAGRCRPARAPGTGSPATVRSGTRLKCWWMTAMPAGAARPSAQPRRRAVDQDQPALVRPVHAGQAFHQGRLAGAVLARQRHHLAGGDVEGHALQRLDAGEQLAEADECDATCRRRAPARRGAPRTVRRRGGGATSPRPSASRSRWLEQHREQHQAAGDDVDRLLRHLQEGTGRC